MAFGLDLNRILFLTTLVPSLPASSLKLLHGALTRLSVGAYQRALLNNASACHVWKRNKTKITGLLAQADYTQHASAVANKLKNAKIKTQNK
jgi:hypothetical protein